MQKLAKFKETEILLTKYKFLTMNSSPHHHPGHSADYGLLSKNMEIKSKHIISFITI